MGHRGRCCVWVRSLFVGLGVVVSGRGRYSWGWAVVCGCCVIVGGCWVSLSGARLSFGGGRCHSWAPHCCSGVACCRLWAACRHLWVVGSLVGGGFVCGWCRSFVGEGLMFVGGGLMFVGDDRLVGGGCRSGVGGRLFIVLSSCCVVRVVVVRRGWETEGYSPERPRR